VRGASSSSTRARTNAPLAEAEAEDNALNARAGYVYVFSDLGAFGDGVIKIGMTRRLNLMERVRELGGASISFLFDVHALFFSTDAVGIETMLHQSFADRRVNLLNLRREYLSGAPATSGVSNRSDMPLQFEGTFDSGEPPVSVIGRALG
jgi:hypothetical protein